jgi:hypothetical protein
MDASNFGKGAIATPDEIKSDQFRLAAVPPMIVDWSVPFRVPAALVQKNQDGSSSCTAQATNYYCQVLNQINHGVSEIYSSRWIYSQTNLGYGQGSYIWKAMSIPIKLGAASLNSVPEEDSTESEMIDSSDNIHAILEARTDKYAVIPHAGQGIDYLCQIIKDYNGFVTGFNGWDGMFDSTGMVIDWSKSAWGHGVYVCGYEMHEGKKCLVFKNSWGSQWGDGGFGYFPEDFISSGMMFDAYVYAVIEDIDPTSMNNRFVRAEKDVWLVRNGQRSLVYNALAFNLISGEWDKIEIINQSQLDAIPDNGKVIAGLDQE